MCSLRTYIAIHLAMLDMRCVVYSSLCVIDYFVSSILQEIVVDDEVYFKKSLRTVVFYWSAK